MSAFICYKHNIKQDKRADTVKNMFYNQGVFTK